MPKEEKFEKLYEELVKENEKELENKRKQVLKQRKIQNIWIITFVLLIFIGGPIISILISESTGIEDVDDSVLLAILAIIYIVVAIYLKVRKPSKATEFWDIFRNKILIKLIKSFDETLEYREVEGIPSEVYKQADFEKYNMYASNNLITGNINKNCKTQIADVESIYCYIDKEGKKQSKMQFGGMFAVIETPKPFNTKIYIRKDIKDNEIIERFSNKLPFDKLTVKLDSQEFEQKFDVYAENPIIAMQLLTADIMQMLMEFANSIENSYEITIKDNHIYIRIWNRSILRIYSLKDKAVDKENIYKNYKILEFMLSLSEKMVKLIDETEYI